jgi:subtilisin family serine protease
VRIDRGKKGFDDLDGNGHGTHVAATIAGAQSVPREAGSADILELNGMAPEAKLYGFKVLKNSGSGEDAFIIKALDTIADLNERAGQLVIHGVNLSLGGGFDPSVFGCGHTPLCQELRRLWRQGVLVVLAAGNEGYAVIETEDGAVPANMDLSIGDPANLEEAIAVGSIHKTNPHTYGVSYFSSRGPTADGRLKPDLVAPGERILSARHKWPKDAATARDLYVEMSGTSMAAPHVSGLLAAFLSARREFVGYPERVKAMLLAQCTDLARDPYIQGRGMPNLVKMLMNT